MPSDPPKWPPLRAGQTLQCWAGVTKIRAPLQEILAMRPGVPINTVVCKGKAPTRPSDTNLEC